jgi:hypothetical protein
MRKIVPVVECDHCEASDLSPETKSSIITVELPGQREEVYSGESCERCQGEFDAALHALLNSYLRVEARPVKRGRPPSAAKRDPDYVRPARLRDQQGETPVEDRTCPVCGGVQKNRGALSAHVRDRHKTTLTQLGIGRRGQHTKRGARLAKAD